SIATAAYPRPINYGPENANQIGPTLSKHTVEFDLSPPPLSSLYKLVLVISHFLLLQQKKNKLIQRNQPTAALKKTTAAGHHHCLIPATAENSFCCATKLIMASSDPNPDKKQLSAGDGKFAANDEQNVLQKHVMFFDRNHDGIIYPWETFQGFRAIGCGFLLSAAAAIFINLGLSSKTRPGRFPSLLLPIEIRFVPAKFEEIFSKHARSHPDALTSDELGEMLKQNREPKNYAGWLGSYSEWKILFLLGKDENGLLQKDTVRSVYDGSLFERMEKERQSSSKNKP
ncbi:unnamed protein product, partial [Linum tenue]